MPHVRFPTGGGLAQMICFPASSECFSDFSREFTYEVTATLLAASLSLGPAVLKLESILDLSLSLAVSDTVNKSML